jgi:putative flippase GtrA
MKIEKKNIIDMMKAFLAFVLTGIGNAVLDYILYLIFNYIFLVPVVLSQVISYSLTTVDRYIITKILIFGGKPTGKILSVELPRFIVVSILNLGLSAVLMFILYSVVGYNDLISKGIVTLATSILNGLSYNFIVFKHIKKIKE